MGPLRIEFSVPVNLDDVRKENSNLQIGGRFKPKDCIALQKVAIIIPFRKRDEHLKYWLYYLHPILQRQQLDYGIYIINQVCPSQLNNNNNKVYQNYFKLFKETHNRAIFFSKSFVNLLVCNKPLLILMTYWQESRLDIRDCGRRF